MTHLRQQLERDIAFGFISGDSAGDQIYNPLLISNHGSNTMLKAILDELKRSHTFTISVAFVTPSAIALLKQALLNFRGRGRIVTSTYLGFNSPAAFRELLNLDMVDVYLYPDDKDSFHAKGYVFEQTGMTTAIVGSSNLTDYALTKNHEWNLRFSALPDGDIVEQLADAVQKQLSRSTALTSSWIERYEESYEAQKYRARVVVEAPELFVDELATSSEIRPNKMQVEALEAIKTVRDSGETRAVVVSATGTGKTILSALDVKAFAPEKMLFVVHREQILDRAIIEFKHVLGVGDDEVGKFVGGQRDLQKKYVFATIQSISRSLGSVPADLFDYVLIDEVHRAGARTYLRLIEALTPAFLLGMTATPERTDGFNVYELFDFNVPYEIRLQKALEADMLAPFHYYGVTDFVTADGHVVDDVTELSKLVAPERVDHLIDRIETYGHAGAPVRGLMFCSRKAEAHELSALLNLRMVHGRQLRTVALTGDDSVDRREAVVEQLEAGAVDYILTVDVFNEGIDIPSVNQVVMLRQTVSSIIFTQQLGRGLRKAQGKDHLIVIDFIGNYANNYLIPIALFGDNSLNKDSIRKNIMDSQEAGVIAGLSSINFDRISGERVFRSLATTKLDSLMNIKSSILELENRLGHPPKLLDFARFDTADPVVVATRPNERNYWSLLARLKKVESAPTTRQSELLRFLSVELLNGKRPHELLLLKELLAGNNLTVEQFRDLLIANECYLNPQTTSSVERILALAFFTEAERLSYGNDPVVTREGNRYALCDELAGGHSEFREHVLDVVETGLFLARHRYRWDEQLQVGQRYSRKDVCRLLNWTSNQQSTIYGYKVDVASNSCPIFITYHKDEDVSASTRYEDEFINPSTLTWFTRSRRTLQSSEVAAIVENQLPLYLFAKKDDAEGTDFYYLGGAKSVAAKQAQMPDGNGKELNVVNVTLDMVSAVETTLYDYLVNASSPS